MDIGIPTVSQEVARANAEVLLDMVVEVLCGIRNFRNDGTFGAPGSGGAVAAYGVPFSCVHVLVLSCLNGARWMPNLSLPSFGTALQRTTRHSRGEGMRHGRHYVVSNEETLEALQTSTPVIHETKCCNLNRCQCVNLIVRIHLIADTQQSKVEKNSIQVRRAIPCRKINFIKLIKITWGTA